MERLKDDKDLEKAVEVLGNSAEYTRILSVPVAASAAK